MRLIKVPSVSDPDVKRHLGPNRVSHALWNLLACVLAAFPLVLLVAPPAYGYVDPSVMTYTIQAVAGVAVALSAVIGVAIRRTRQVIFRAFHIDEKSRKVIEEPVVRIDESCPDAIALRAETEESAKKAVEFLDRGPEIKKLNWPKRFIRALTCCGFLIFTIFIMSPLEIVAGSADSLNFDFLDIAPTIITAGVIAILASAAIIACIPGRAFDVVTALIVAIGVCAYIQALFLNTGLPAADGLQLLLEEHQGITIISAELWFVVIVGLFALCMWKRQVCRSLIITLSVCLLIVQGVGLVDITLGEQRKADEKEVTLIQTTQGLYEVSASENVIVIVLDYFDTQLLEEIRAEYPNALDEFTGFTYFRNSVGSMIPTRYGIPFLLTGSMPQEGDTYESFLAERYERSNFLETIYEAGYDITIYSDSVLSDKPAALASNYLESETFEINKEELVAALEKAALYRDLPWLLKPFFWFYTDELNRVSIAHAHNPYVMNDIDYVAKLRADGLSLNDKEKSFHFIHLLGAHFPYIMTAEGTASEKELTIQIQGRGALRVVADYLQELKRMNLYDSSTIIITSDHGYFHTIYHSPERAVTPILLAKPAETAEEASKPLKVSDVPTGHLDFHATVLDAMGLDASAYGPTFFDVSSGPRPRYYWMTGHDGTNDLYWREYEINGHVFDFGNWKRTGREINIP